ncbi:hypothetical protein BDP27DRAFT_1425474 [Rhodocollybia butyracea]|uniref:Uncharacterized protein n=1 Tax=Rhodocollybia butyracea TaxID=206335 RepID=A0A9P5PK25_9AGAR|nr:hypothetical protein BDP27DRAFT_1425474 [Rhodocollybia butyracea]
MQPKHICLYLLAMLMFTSTGHALPVKLHQPGEVHPSPNDPRSALPQHLTRRVAPISPFKAWFLDPEGRLIPNFKKWDEPHDQEITRIARARVGNALAGISKLNAAKGKSDAVHKLLDLEIPVSTGPAPAATSTGRKVRKQPAWRRRELHYPDDNLPRGFGKLYADRGTFRGTLDGDVATFTKFLAGFKQKVREAKEKAKNTGKEVEWPILETTVSVPVPASPSVGSHQQGASKSNDIRQGTSQPKELSKDLGLNDYLKGAAGPPGTAPATGSGADIAPAPAQLPVEHRLKMELTSWLDGHR